MEKYKIVLKKESNGSIALILIHKVYTVNLNSILCTSKNILDILFELQHHFKKTLYRLNEQKTNSFKT
jgi:hypothetical protein